MYYLRQQSFVGHSRKFVKVEITEISMNCTPVLLNAVGHNLQMGRER